MNWRNLGLMILAAIILIGLPVQSVPAQKKGNKIIDKSPNLPPVKKIEGQKTGKRGILGNEVTQPQTSKKLSPKQLFVEVKISGSGSDKCPLNTTSTCTWSINRTYTTTAILDQFLQMPMVASGIPSSQKTEAFNQAIAGGALSPRWTTLPTIENMKREVEVSINDSLVISWIEKNKKVENGKDILLPDTTKTHTMKWSAVKIKGTTTNFAEVTMDRQAQVFKVRMSLNSDAKMDFTEEKSWEMLGFLVPQKMGVFALPQIQNGFSITEPTIAFGADMPDVNKAAFEKTFPSLKPKANVGLGPIDWFEDKCAITVTYKFQ